MASSVCLVRVELLHTISSGNQPMFCNCTAICSIPPCESINYCVNSSSSIKLWMPVSQTKAAQSRSKAAGRHVTSAPIRQRTDRETTWVPPGGPADVKREHHKTTNHTRRQGSKGEWQPSRDLWVRNSPRAWCQQSTAHIMPEAKHHEWSEVTSCQVSIQRPACVQGGLQTLCLPLAFGSQNHSCGVLVILLRVTKNFQSRNAHVSGSALDPLWLPGKVLERHSHL